MRSSNYPNGMLGEQGSIKSRSADVYGVNTSNDNDILNLPTRPILQDDRSTSPITVPPAYQNSLFTTVERDKIPPAIKGPDPPKKPKFILKSPLPKDEIDEGHIHFNEFYNFSPEIRLQEQEYQVRREKEKSAFDKWLVNKILHDDTLKILESLCNKQGSEYSAPNNITCEELAECLVCIDFRYGLWKSCHCPVFCTNPQHNVLRFNEICKCSAKKCIMCRGCINCKGTFRSQCDCEIKSLGDTFVIMARQFLQCVDVEVSRNIYYQFNESGREMQFYELNDPKANGKYILRNLKYSLRPPSNNERIMNSIITMKTKKLYLKKVDEISAILEQMDVHSHVPYLNKHGQTQLLGWIYNNQVNKHIADQQIIDEKFDSNYKMWEGFVYANQKKVKLSVEQYMYDIKQKELCEIQPMIDDNYRQWKNNKYYIEQARFYLSRINLPSSKKMYRLKTYQFSEDEDKMMHLWKIVGENLKTIDPSLEGDFHDWSSSRYSNHLSHTVWDMLPPVACDIHHISTPTRLLLQHFFYYTNNCLLHLAELFLPIVRKNEEKDEDQPPASLVDVLKKLRKCMRECIEMEDENNENDDEDDEDDDGNEYTGKNTIYKLNYKQFDIWLKKINCNFIQSDKEMIYSLFNKGQNNTIYAYKILQYIGLYPHKNRIDKICKWKFVCHLCGMNRAFDFDGKTEMKDHKLRRVNPFVEECHKIQIDKPKQCEACKSTQEDKIKSLEILHQIALQQLKTEVMEARFASCEKPHPPLFTYEPGDFTGDNKTSSFTLKWKSSNENDIILFFVLEIQSNNSKRFEEVCKDPPNINELSEGKYTHENVDCYHQYRYRLSAINTGGRSTYVYLDPQPEPLPPPVTPYLLSNTSFSIQLCWDNRNEIKKIIRQIVRVFEDCDNTNSNEVCLAEFIKAINQNSDVMNFLVHFYPKKIPARLNQDKILQNKKVSLYDLLTALDSYSITWEDLSEYLYSSPKIRPTNSLPRNGKFLLERCISAERDEWAIEYEGEEAFATIYHLKPSTYYKFRVRAKGSDGQMSEPGKIITGYSLLPQPDPPELLSETSISSNIIKLKLKEYKSLNKQDNDTKLKEGMRLNELIAGWAGYNLSRDIDYEIKNVVQPYINENGNINPNDFENVIHSIGLEMDEDQMNQGIDELVENNEISLYSLNNWLMSSKIKYNIQVIPVNKRSEKMLYSTKYSSIITLSELEPDTKYQICLQLSTNVNRSYYSKPTFVNTLPLAPSSIITVDLNSNEVYLKWYYEGPNNSSYNKSYTLEIRGPILENKICNWRTYYQGQTAMCYVSDLKPGNSYEFRVNCNGSNWSESKLIETLEEYESYVSNLNVFTIDDNDDVSLGDLILFKERGKKMVGRVIKESEIRNSNGISISRNLSISVIMSRIHQYKPGMIIQRKEEDLYEKSGNEVLRKPWEDEDDRRHKLLTDMSSSSSFPPMVDYNS